MGGKNSGAFAWASLVPLKGEGGGGGSPEKFNDRSTGGMGMNACRERKRLRASSKRELFRGGSEGHFGGSAGEGATAPGPRRVSNAGPKEGSFLPRKKGRRKTSVHTIARPVRARRGPPMS